jgi:hypothetical protein
MKSNANPSNTPSRSILQDKRSRSKEEASKLLTRKPREKYKQVGRSIENRKRKTARDIHSWTHEKEKTSNALLYMVVNADPHPSDTFGSNAKRRNRLSRATLDAEKVKELNRKDAMIADKKLHSRNTGKDANAYCRPVSRQVY